MGVVFVSHKTAYMLSDSPVHVGIFSSATLHARSIYLAANYRRSAAAANYFESLAGVLETQRHTHHHFHGTFGWGVGVDCASLVTVYRSVHSPGSNKKQLHTLNNILVM